MVDFYWRNIMKNNESGIVNLAKVLVRNSDGSFDIEASTDVVKSMIESYCESVQKTDKMIKESVVGFLEQQNKRVTKETLIAFSWNEMQTKYNLSMNDFSSTRDLIIKWIDSNVSSDKETTTLLSSSQGRNGGICLTDRIKQIEDFAKASKEAKNK